MTLPRQKLTPLSSGYVCADCSDVEPCWASLNRGVLICTECCSIHRSLGRHVSHVKSLKRAAWNTKQLALVQTLFAHGSNNVWEHLLLDPTGASKAKKKPGPRDPLYPTKADFIRAKYQNLSYALRLGRGFGDNSSGQSDTGGSALSSSPADLNRQLHSCVRTGHVETTLRLLALGADPNGHVDPDTGATPLHVAAREGQELQVELLVLYGADPVTSDFNGQKPAEAAAASGNHDLSLRLMELQYELTDRLVAYLCGGRKPDHENGQHFIIPEISTQSDSAASKAVRRRIRMLSDAAFEKLAQDAYDEVDRREVDASWSACLAEEALLINDRYVVPFLPVNADLPSTRNQRRQKLAKFNGREFAALLIDIVSEAKRRLLHLSQGEDKAISEPSHDQKRSHPKVTTGTADGQRRQGDSTSTDSPLHSSAKEITASGNLAENDGPVYDTVASDEEDGERNVGLPVLVDGTPSDDYVDLKSQLAAAEARVEVLEKRNSDVSSEVEQLRRSVERLSSENQHLKTSSIHLPQRHLEPELLEALQTLHSPNAIADSQNAARILTTRHSGDVLCTESEPEARTQRSAFTRQRNMGNDSSCRRRRSSADVALKKTGPLSPSTKPDKELYRDWEDSICYPDNLILKTEHLTSEIHQLLGAAQAGRHDTFSRFASRIQLVVDSMVHAVPAQFKRQSIQQALDTMVDACLLLTVRCSNTSSNCSGAAASIENAEKLSCQIVQVAYEVASAAKELMVLIQK